MASFRIQSVSITPNPVNVSSSIKIEVEVIDNTWGRIKESFTSWKAIKDSVTDWSKIKTY